MAEQTTFCCEHCQRELSVSQRRDFDGSVMCVECRDALTELCVHCYTRLWNEDMETAFGHPVCPQCLDARYSHCAECGALVYTDDLYYLNDDDDEGYCGACYHSHGENRAVQSYYYKPEPIFYGEGNRFFGVELEIDGGGELDRKANQIMEVANQNGLELLYVKHDGSLEDGLELVTHPLTPAFHMNKMPWGAVLAEAISLGYTSHQARTCGLHVHVNRTAFGDTRERQEDVIARILFFVENHWNELVRFSRRTKHQLSEWSARYGRKDDPKAVLDHAKSTQFQRYTCVNLTNATTIEFRMFRGTLKLNTLLATLQLVDRVCDVALCLSDQEMQELTWTDFVAGCTAPELVQYLKERRLYVSDPVAAEAEV